MSAEYAIRSIIEGLVVLGIIAGLIFEDRLIDFEDAFCRAIKRLFCRGKSKKSRRKTTIINFPEREMNKNNAG